MKRIFPAIAICILTAAAYGQRANTVITGTAVIYGSGFNTRTVTRNFTLRLNGSTSARDVSRFVGILQERGQDGLLNAIDDERVGNFSLGAQVGRDVNVAYVERVGNQLRIRAVFARWLGFGELRAGSRSVDYPFSYIEIYVDPATGRGEGTFIPAARIRFREREGENQVEIEDFGTFPGRLLGVRMSGNPLT